MSKPFARATWSYHLKNECAMKVWALESRAGGCQGIVSCIYQICSVNSKVLRKEADEKAEAKAAEGFERLIASVECCVCGLDLAYNNIEKGSSGPVETMRYLYVGRNGRSSRGTIRN